ncbi:MAG: hypothetical protein PHO42_05660 [Candidatus Omnitrophica bacterium]|nr:hypothetical protein [Candidatus Omnitrophota bacterium]
MNKKGIILISAYAIVAILLFICGVTFIGRSLNEKHIADRHRRGTMALYLAESGLERGLGWLRAQSSPPAGTTAFNPFTGMQSLGNGTYSVTIDPDDANATSYIKRYLIIATGTVLDATQQLVNEVQVDSFSRYAYFSDTEHFRWFGWFRVPVWFADGDTIEGPVQTNSHFHMKGSPLFIDQVKSVDTFLTFYNNGHNIDSAETSNPPLDVPTFEDGVGLGADVIDMPSKALDLRTAAVAGGLHLSGPTSIVLNADGTMNVTNRNKDWTNQNMTLPANGALFVTGGDLTVSGTLNGQLSMGTNRNIVVNNNLTYAADPRVGNSDDVLGLIAEKDVVISGAAPNNVEVDGSVMALGNSFLVENWWVGPAKGTLTVYGGIIQRERGPVGMAEGNSGQPLSGYRKNYHYDPRFIGTPPPYYPSTGDYISLCWKEQ